MDDEQWYQAAISKDARFDGVFFIGVSSTGIYCRPSCPAITPKREHMRYYRTAAAAQEAGYRACKRCRPDASPGSPEWNIRADVVGRAMRLIADGVVDREGVAGLAGRVGYEQRQVRRLITAELGAGPLAIARAQRAQTARVLTETTTLPLSETGKAKAVAVLPLRQKADIERANAPRCRSVRRCRGGLQGVRAGDSVSVYVVPGLTVQVKGAGRIHCDRLVEAVQPGDGNRVRARAAVGHALEGGGDSPGEILYGQDNGGGVRQGPGACHNRERISSRRAGCRVNTQGGGGRAGHGDVGGGGRRENQGKTRKTRENQGQ